MKIIDKIQNYGVSKVVFSSITILRNAILFAKYKFDFWHIRSNFYTNIYKQRAIELSQKVNTDIVLEIGCGLADILSRVDGRLKIGIDPDIGVINASKSIFGNSCLFLQGDLENCSEKLIKENITKVNLLIMVNWPHILDFQTLSSGILKIIRDIQVNYLLIDLINDDAEGYPFKHKISDMDKIGSIEFLEDGGDGARKLALVKLKVLI
jgi:hypothetical protein